MLIRDQLHCQDQTHRSEMGKLEEDSDLSGESRYTLLQVR